jgi:hypothetical protein
VTRRGIGQVALLAAAMMAAAGGLGDYLRDGPEDQERWKRKKWQKGPSGGPGGPTVRLKIPRGRKP